MRSHCCAFSLVLCLIIFSQTVPTAQAGSFSFHTNSIWSPYWHGLDAVGVGTAQAYVINNPGSWTGSGVSYTYTGNPFDYFDNGSELSGSNFITLTITLPQLGANMALDNIFLPSFEFTFFDGVHRASSSAGDYAVISSIQTDEYGNIILWNIGGYHDDTSPVPEPSIFVLLGIGLSVVGINVVIMDMRSGNYSCSREFRR
jgi:hypothetical protein